MKGPLRDIVIVGGGPAGCTTAIALAHAAPELAPRILILERHFYPRDKPCAGALGARGDGVLLGLGVLVDVPSVRIDGISLRARAGEATASPGRIGRVVRRTEFDWALARAARARGIAVREGVRVSGVRQGSRGDADVETTDGTIAARVVVGCDGVGSAVRRSLGVGAGRWRAQVIEVDTEPVSHDGGRPILHVDVSDRRLRGYAWDFPTLGGGRALVSRGVYQLRRQRGAGSDSELDIGDVLDGRLRSLGLDPASYPKKRYAERGYEPGSSMARGPVMLVGEAAGVDPATGEGISQAIECGKLAAEFLAPRLRSTTQEPLLADDWTATFARSRLARDLRIRTTLVRLFFSPARPSIERVLTASSGILHVGCQHFAGQSLAWSQIARSAGPLRR